MPRSVTRSLGFAGMVAPLALVLTLSACDSGSGSSSASTVVIRVSSYVTNPVVTQVATTQAGDSVPDGATSAQEQEYTVKAGDFLSRIANRYGVSMEEIANYNKWSDGTSHNLFPDDVVKIPPGADVPSAEPDRTTTTEGDGDAPPDTEGDGNGSGDAPKCPDGSRQPTYEVESGDIPIKVADKTNTELADLAAANEGNPAYGQFIPGQTLYLPCKDDTGDTTG